MTELKAALMRLRFKTFLANEWARAFLSKSRKSMAPLVQDMRSLEADIKQAAQTLFDENARTLPDNQGCMILAMCSMVLAAHRQLREYVEPGVAFDVVRRTLEQTYAAPMRWYFRIWLRMTRDPVGFLQRRSLANYSRRMYGQSMEFAEESTDDSIDLLVTRCAFHQFFVDHGEPTLTLLFCAWDRNWMDVVDRSARPIRTERPTTISTGGECCRFRYVRDEGKSDALPPNDVVLVELEG